MIHIRRRKDKDIIDTITAQSNSKDNAETLSRTMKQEAIVRPGTTASIYSKNKRGKQQGPIVLSLQCMLTKR